MCQKHSRRDLYFNYITTTEVKGALARAPAGERLRLSAGAELRPCGRHQYAPYTLILLL